MISEKVDTTTLLVFNQLPPTLFKFSPCPKPNDKATNVQGTGVVAFVSHSSSPSIVGPLYPLSLILSVFGFYKVLPLAHPFPPRIAARQDTTNLARDRRNELWAKAMKKVRLSFMCQRIQPSALGIWYCDGHSKDFGYPIYVGEAGGSVSTTPFLPIPELQFFVGRLPYGSVLLSNDG